MKIAAGFSAVLGGKTDYTSGITVGTYLMEMDACLFR
jgi:hypothetical protein